jgi:hypothetical protein
VKVGIIQSNYIPWKGYFDLIHDVDLFVFYDDVQFTKNDWRNRNKLKSPSGSCWISIPVGCNIKRLICDVAPCNVLWQKKHWKTICQLYGKSPYFGDYRAFLKHVYCGCKWNNLSQLNRYLIKYIAQECLGINTQFLDSSELPNEGKKQERLLKILVGVGANVYISGPAAKAYLEPEIFEDLDIELIWKDYSGYPEYPQFYPPFTHNVSILDLLFHTGPDAPYYIWGWREFN